MLEQSLVLNTTTTNAVVQALNGGVVDIVDTSIIGNTRAIDCDSGAITATADSIICGNEAASTPTSCGVTAAISIDGDDSCDTFCPSASGCVPNFDAITTEGSCSASWRAPTFCRACYICGE